MTDGTSRHGSRDNGLRCGGYVPVADLDPRIADALLSVLRDAGIAAYAAPTPASTGGAMESRLPSRPIDRLWVDDQQTARAKELVDEQTREPDIDAAWQQVLMSLQTPSTSPVPQWPVSEDVDDDSSDNQADRAESGEPADPADDEHFEPPPPPPFPRLHRKTVAAIASILVGLVILATNFDGGSFTFLAVLAILAGLASLVWRMHDGPPTDSGWDDGAVV
jgi:hypothetical protein